MSGSSRAVRASKTRSVLKLRKRFLVGCQPCSLTPQAGSAWKTELVMQGIGITQADSAPAPGLLTDHICLMAGAWVGLVLIPKQGTWRLTQSSVMRRFHRLSPQGTEITTSGSGGLGWNARSNYLDSRFPSGCGDTDCSHLPITSIVRSAPAGWHLV